MPDTEESKISVGDVSSHVAAIGRGAEVIVSIDKRGLREWWHELLREYDRHACYAFFLMLPSDNEVISYLTEYGKELDIISGKNCLVIAISQSKLKGTSFDEIDWRNYVKEQSDEGYSTTIGRLFNIDFTKFPCLIIFEDIRGEEHVFIELGGMGVKDIATKMRLVFSIIEQAIKGKKMPLEELENQLTSEITRSTNHHAENIFETAMKLLTEAVSSLPPRVTINNEIVQGDKITTRDIIGSNSVSVGREAHSETKQEVSNDG